jgi:hypothetical protein
MFSFLARLKELVIRHRDYCVKCREHQRVRDTEYTDIRTAAGPRRSRRGTCTVCGARTSQFIAA